MSPPVLTLTFMSTEIPSDSDPTLPWASAGAFLAEVVNDGGSGGRLLDVREGEGGTWDVVLLLDGGYTSREEAVETMKLYADYVRRAYLAEVDAGHIPPARDADLVKLGLRRDAV